MHHGRWPLATALATYPGPDGQVRVAKVRTSSGEYTRPITRLVRLPLSKPSTRVDRNQLWAWWPTPCEEISFQERGGRHCWIYFALREFLASDAPARSRLTVPSPSPPCFEGREERERPAPSAAPGRHSTIGVCSGRTRPSADVSRATYSTSVLRSQDSAYWIIAHSFLTGTPPPFFRLFK